MAQCKSRVSRIFACSLAVFALLAGCDLFNIGSNQAPQITIENEPPTIFDDETVTIILSATDPDSDPLQISWFVEGLEQIGQSSDTFVFTAEQGVAGTFTVRVEVSDGALSATVSLIVTVLERPIPNQAPSVSILAPTTSLDWDTPETFQAIAVDLDGDALSYQWYVDTIAQAGATSAVFAFSAAPDLVTNYSLSVTVSDGELSDSDMRTITVAGIPNRAPVITLTTPATSIGNGESITISAAVTDPDGDSFVLSWSVDGSVVGGETGTDFVFVRSPTFGTTYQVAVSADDGELTATAQLVISVVGIDNEAPEVTLSGPIAIVANGSQVTATASATDPDGDALEYRWYIGAELQVGVAADTLLFSKSPADRTTYTVRVEVDDGQFVGEATLYVTVEGSNPVIVATGVYELHGVWVASTATPPDGIVDIAEFEDRLYALTDSATIHTLDGTWTQGPDSPPLDSVSIAEYASTLYAITAYGALYYLEGSWKQSPVALLPDATSIGVHGGVLYALTGSGTLYYLEGTWKTDAIGVPGTTVALSQTDDSLLAILPDGSVQKRETSWYSNYTNLPDGAIGYAITTTLTYSVVPNP